MAGSMPQHEAVDSGIDDGVKTSERNSSAKSAEPPSPNAIARMDHAEGEHGGAKKHHRNKRNNNHQNHSNYNNHNSYNRSATPSAMGNGRLQPFSRSKGTVAKSPYGEFEIVVQDGDWDSSDSFFPATSNQRSNVQSSSIVPYHITLKNIPKTRFEKNGYHTAQINALLAKAHMPPVGAGAAMRNSSNLREATTNPSAVPDIKAEQSEVVQKQNAASSKEQPEVFPFVPPHLRIPVPKLSAIQASLKTTSGQNAKPVDSNPSATLNAEVHNTNGKSAKLNPSAVSSVGVSNVISNPRKVNPGGSPDAKAFNAKGKEKDPNPNLSVHEDGSNNPPPVQRSSKGKEPATKGIDTALAPHESCSNVSKNSQASTADGQNYEKEPGEFERHPLVGWDGNWMAPPVEWGGRPSFNPKNETHMKTINAWTQEQAGEALINPVTIDIGDPLFETGEATAEGDIKLGTPIDIRLHETILPDDDFTKAKFHETAADAQKKHRTKIIVEKNDQYSTKAERKAYRDAMRLARANYVPPPNPHAPRANIYIRPAEAKDLPQITGIYNHYIEHSVIAPEREQHNEQQWRARWIDATESNYAFLVAVQLSAKGGGHSRRTSRETICGFIYAEDFGNNHNAYRYTCEMQVYVGNWTLRMGIGKCLIDRMMTALDPGYCARGGAKFDGGEDPIRYQGGGIRVIHKVLINVPYAAKDESTLKWLKDWLAQWHFEQVSMLPGVGRKFDRA